MKNKIELSHWEDPMGYITPCIAMQLTDEEFEVLKNKQPSWVKKDSSNKLKSGDGFMYIIEFK